MTEMLTAKQVQDLLKVDRTTVYRMLKDGRLNGIKVGQQWRFPHSGVNALLSGGRPVDRTTLPSVEPLPLQWLQMIQDVFADIAGVGSLTVKPNGEPLTKISNSCAFCRLILASESGRRGCLSTWRKLSEQRGDGRQFQTCHAGLQCAQVRVEAGGRLAAVFIAGQFYATNPDPTEEQARIRRLAAAYSIDAFALTEAARGLPCLDERKRAQMGDWLARLAQVMERVARDRAELVSRLDQIAVLSSLASASGTGRLAVGGGGIDGDSR